MGAGEQQFERLAGALQGSGVAQYALLGPTGHRSERLQSLGIEQRQLEFPGRFKFLDKRTINGEIRRFEPDLIVSWTHGMGQLVDSDVALHLGRINRTFDPTQIGHYDHLLTPSQARADKCMAVGWSPERVHVVPPLLGADAIGVGKHTSVKKVDRRVYFTPSTTTLALTAAEFDADSGIDVLIKAIARLSGFYLWIAGDGPGRAALEDYAHELGVKPRVRFLGWQDDLRPFLAVSDMFVSPGGQDDTGKSMLEAWACGVPVIAADALGPGLLIRQKENGVIVPVGDAINMAEAIKWLSRDPAAARSLGEAGRNAFGENWTMDKVLPKYLSLFEQLAKKPMTAA